MSEPNFHVVLAADANSGAWEVLFISSIADQAAEFAAKERDSGHGAVVTANMSRAQVRDIWLEERLGQLHDVLLRLEAKV